MSWFIFSHMTGTRSLAYTDLQKLNPTAHCFSRTNLYYVKKFYLTYSSYTIKVPQLGGQIEKIPQLGEQITQHVEGNAGDANTPQVVEQIKRDIMSIGWGHHKLLMDKCSDNPQKAIFFVHQTVLNGWSRSMLLNFLDAYDRYQVPGIYKCCGRTEVLRIATARAASFPRIGEGAGGRAELPTGQTLSRIETRVKTSR